MSDRPAPARGRSISLRHSLLQNALLLILLLSGATLTATFVVAERSIEALSRAAMQTTLAEVGGSLQGFFEPVRDAVAVTRAWGEAGLLDIERPELLNRTLVPLLRAHPQIASVIIADDRGREYLLLRSPRRWRMRLTRHDEWDARVRWLEWTDAEPEPVESWQESDYDPRTRPWYRGAIEQRGRAHSVHWTEPYAFFTTREPGITASTVFDPGDGSRHIVAFDVLLRDVSRFTSSLQVRENGMALVLTHDGRVIGLPKSPRSDRPEAQRAALLQTEAELKLPVLEDARQAYQAGGRPSGRPYSFRSGLETWWSERGLFAIAPDRSLWIVALVPQAELMGAVSGARVAILALTIAAVALGLVQAVLLSRRLSRPIELLAAQSERIGQGDLEPGAPVTTSVTEVRRLADAQDEMRVALRSLVAIERDLALAREIQQATLPRELPSLPPFELAAWSDPADQTGGDSYDAARVGAQRAVLMLADATGHGVAPALSVTQLRAMLRMALRSEEPIDRIAMHLNAQLHEDLPSGRFITAWIAELDAAAGTLRQFSAGQGPILSYRAATGEVTSDLPDAPPFAVLPELEVEISPALALEPGDCVAVLSDGIFESQNPEGELFGSERVAALLTACADEPPSLFLGRLRDALTTFSRGRPADDDCTALIVRRAPAPAARASGSRPA